MKTTFSIVESTLNYLLLKKKNFKKFPPKIFIFCIIFDAFLLKIPEATPANLFYLKKIKNFC